MNRDGSEAQVRLSDLRRAHPADSTLENLLTSLTAKIQACAKLAVFEYEAGSEGHAELAMTFRKLGATERESFNILLESLRRHLEELPHTGIVQCSESAHGGRR